MNVLRGALMGLLLSGAMIAPTWGSNCLMYMYDPTHTGYTEEELSADLALQWKFTTDEDTQHSAPPVVYGDTVFYCANGVVYALDAVTGGIKWRFPKEVEERRREEATGGPAGGTAGAGMGAGGARMGAAGPGGRAAEPGRPAEGEAQISVDRLAPIRVSPALDPEGRILYVGADDGSLYALNTQNGNLLKLAKAGAAIRSAPVIEEGILYFGANDHKIYAVDAKSLELAWEDPMYVGDMVNQPICLTPDLMVFTTGGGVTFVIDRKSLQERWRQRFGYIAASSIAAGDFIYAAADAAVEARRRKSERLWWKFKTPSGANILAPPAIANSTLYVASQDSFIYALRMADGAPLWQQTTGMDPDLWEKVKGTLPQASLEGGAEEAANAAEALRGILGRIKGFGVLAAPIISGKDLWVGTERGFVVRLDAQTGAPRWLYKLDPEETTGEGGKIRNVTAPPVAANGALYVCTEDSTLYCFRPEAIDIGAPHVRDEQIITKARDDSEVAVDIYEKQLMEEFPDDLPPLQLRSQYPFRFYAVLSDEGSGIRLNSLEVQFDGQRTDAVKYDLSTGELRVELMAPPAPGSMVQPQFEDGEHTIQLTVSDWRGNVSTKVWTFTVDNTLPPLEPTEKEEEAGPGQGPGQQGGRRGRQGGQGPGGAGGMGPGGPGGGGIMGPGGGAGAY